MSNNNSRAPNLCCIIQFPSHPWMRCESNHGRSPTRVGLTTVADNTRISETLIPDASLWLKEVKCHRSNCHRLWLGCSLCNWRCPQAGNISGKKRGRALTHRDELSDTLMKHRDDPFHVAQLATLLQDQQPDNMQGTTFESNDDLRDESQLVPPSPTAIILASCDQTAPTTELLLSEIAARNPPLGEYLKQESRERKMGARYIVSLACEADRRRRNGAAVVIASPAPDFGTQFMLDFTVLFQALSVKDRPKLVRLMDVAFSTPPDERSGVNFGHARVPAVYTEARRVCMIGRNAIVKSVPIARTVLVGNPKEQHVCVHPLDALQLALSKLPDEVISNLPIITQTDAPEIPSGSVSSYFESLDYHQEIMKTIGLLRNLGQPSAVQVMIRWFSDAWDPDGTKNNRNGVWTMFMTLMFGPGLDEIVIPVAAGPKAGDHAVAVRWILGEVQKLGETFIVRETGRGFNIRYRVATALIQVDRLERGELWGGLHHAANRGKCYGVVSGYDTLNHAAYSPCQICIIAIVLGMQTSDGVIPSITCRACACYNPLSSLLTGPIPSTITKAKLQVNPIEDWQSVVGNAPSNATISDPSQPPPGRHVSADLGVYGPVVADQTFLLTAAQFLTYETWIGNVTTQKFAECWGEVCGLSKRLALSLFHEAKRHRVLGTADFGTVFARELLPPAWLDSSWCQAKFLSGPMHLLFLGIEETLMNMIDEWLVYHGLKSTFNQHASKACDSMGKLGLQWLRLLKYGVSTLSRGLWVSEQYCAMAKFMLVPFAGLVFAKAPCAAEIKVVLRAVESCFVMMSILMKRSINPLDISRASLAIKLYLASVDELGRLLFIRDKWKKGKPTPPTLTVDLTSEPDAIDNPNSPTDGSDESPVPKGKHYRPVSLNNPNHASLQGIIKSMKSHGPPCDQWEGKKGGEASIQDLKPFFHGVCTVDGGNMEAAMIRYYRTRLLHELSEELEDGSGHTTQRNRYTHVRRYRSTQQVSAQFFLTAANPDDTDDEGTNDADDIIHSDGRKETGGVSGLLFEAPGRDQVLCVAITNVNNRPGQPLLHEVKFHDVQSLCSIAMPQSAVESRSFAGDFLYFGRVTLTCDTVFEPARAGYNDEGIPISFVPGKHIWRDTKNCIAVPTQAWTKLDKLFTVVADDFRRLDSNGTLPVTSTVGAMLWNDIVHDGASITVDWDEAITNKTIDLSNQTKAQLQSILRANDRPVSGNKDVLIERVLALYQEQEQALAAQEHEQATLLEESAMGDDGEAQTAQEQEPAVAPLEESAVGDDGSAADDEDEALLLEDSAMGVNN